MACIPCAAAAVGTPVTALPATLAGFLGLKILSKKEKRSTKKTRLPIS